MPSRHDKRFKRPTRRPLKPKPLSPAQPDPFTPWWPASWSQQQLNIMCGTGVEFNQQTGQCQRDDY